MYIHATSSCTHCWMKKKSNLIFLSMNKTSTGMDSVSALLGSASNMEDGGRRMGRAGASFVAPLNLQTGQKGMHNNLYKYNTNTVGILACKQISFTRMRGYSSPLEFRSKSPKIFRSLILSHFFHIFFAPSLSFFCCFFHQKRQKTQFAM